MTTQQVADRLVTLMRAGKGDDAYRELFTQDATSYEMPVGPTPQIQGLDKLLEQSAKWEENIKEIHELEVTEPLVYKDFFAVGMAIDVTRMDGSRSREEELCNYYVRDGKIALQRFTYPIG